MRSKYTPPRIWLGTEESHMALQDAEDAVRALELQGADAIKAAIQMRGAGRGDDPFGLPPMWEMRGDTAVVNINGSLVNGSAGFFRLFGIVGYDDVVEAVNEATMSKDAKRVVLNISSGGGDVAGVEDAGNAIRAAGKVKPLVAFTASHMFSAAYWLGASANAIYATQTAQLGSIGTMIVATERSKQRAEAGITDKVIRYGRFKALNNPLEPLSAEGEAQLQATANEAGKIFVNYVADRRGMSFEEFQESAGEGRTFMGRLAKKVGLVDAVVTAEELLADTKLLDKRNSTAENARHHAQGTVMKLRALSKAVLLAIAGGTKPEALGLSDPAANVEGTKPEADDVTALQADAAEIHSAFSAATTKAVDSAVATAKAESDKVIGDLTAKVTLLEAGAGDLTAKVKTATDLAASYATVVKHSLSQMSVALGGSKDTGATLSGAELMAEHDKVAEQFKAKFPAGGVAAIAPTAEGDKPTAASVPNVFRHLAARNAKSA